MQHRILVDSWVISHRGHIRANNEDNYILNGSFMPDANSAPWQESGWSQGTVWYLAGVFDGIGGGEQGEAASRIAAECFAGSWEALCNCRQRAEADGVLRRCFQETNNAVIAAKACGTTGTVLCAHSGGFRIYHLGDSRAYLLRHRELFPLTVDHTLVQLQKGRTRDASAAGSHILTQYIGCDRSLHQLHPEESKWIPSEPNDRLLLCSDGLHHMCSPRQIRTCLREASSSRDAARILVDAALSSGGSDNITCLVADFL